MLGVKIRSPTIIFLQRARMVSWLTALIPTVFMIRYRDRAAGHRRIEVGGCGGRDSGSRFCGTALAGYVLGTILVSRGPVWRPCRTSFSRLSRTSAHAL